MNVTSLSGIYSNFIQPILGNTLGVGSSTGAGSSSATTPAAPQDSNQLSPFARIATTLKQLQQQNPAQYRSVTGQIAANLRTAAQTAQKGGNTTVASQLTQLAADFTSASQNNQLPDFQGLVQAISSGQHQPDLLSRFTAGGGTDVLNAGSIISGTLSNAGISLV
ncbi:MAG: hypothetical protein ABSB15_08860 [Bryobacteraceae bacterium]